MSDDEDDGGKHPAWPEWKKHCIMQAVIGSGSYENIGDFED